MDKTRGSLGKCFEVFDENSVATQVLKYLHFFNFLLLLFVADQRDDDLRSEPENNN